MYSQMGEMNFIRTYSSYKTFCLKKESQKDKLFLIKENEQIHLKNNKYNIFFLK